jgi:recombination protein RecT
MNASAEQATQMGNAPIVAGPKEPKSFPAMIEQFKAQISLALPKHLNADRMTRVALTEFRKNPKLAECTPVSVFASVIMASQLGLEPGLNGQGYLVPYFDHKKQVSICQFIPGWRGMVDLAQRSGRATAWTGAVFDGDEFEFEFGTNPFIRHIPHGESDASKLLFTYAVGRVKGAEFPQIEVWPVQKVFAHRDRFNKVGKRHYSFDHPEMYARKVPLLQVLKYLPQSIELSTATALEHAAERGAQRLDIKDAIAGTFAFTDDTSPADDTDTTSAGSDQPATQTEAVKEALRAKQATTKGAEQKAADPAEKL